MHGLTNLKFCNGSLLPNFSRMVECDIFIAVKPSSVSYARICGLGLTFWVLGGKHEVRNDLSRGWVTLKSGTQISQESVTKAACHWFCSCSLLLRYT